MTQNNFKRSQNFQIFFGLIAIAILISCGGDKKTDPSQKQTTEKFFKVALLTPGSISDGGWNALAHNGLKLIETELSAEIKQVESKTPSQWEQHFRFYADKNFDLIFGHGFEYQEPAKNVAKNYPNTIFITSSGNTVADNVSPVRFLLEESTFLLGVIAGMMTKTNKICSIGGQNIPSVNSTFMAFEEGAKSINPEIIVNRAYVGNWENIGKAKELTLSQISEGFDFIFHNANAAGLGVFTGVEEARKNGKNVFAFGSNVDQNAIAPTAILASATIDPRAFLEVAKRVKEKRFDPGVIPLGISVGAIDLVYNPELKNVIPTEVIEKVQAIKRQIVSGEFSAPKAEFD